MATATQELSFEDFKQEVLADYKTSFQSRQASLVGRKEVLTGKAKFGIFGDGKEVPQIAMAKVFKPGDFRSGYYRDQTFMFAKGISDIKAFFAQLYADPNLEREPCSAGRSMNGHFGTRLLDENGNWLSQTDTFNSSADISPTGGQMARLVGLALASKLYRNNPDLHQFTQFSNQGNEVAFGTIGNASTSEGCFWEAINAAGVLQIPMAVSIWDDEYGISVPAKYQTTKEDLSALLSGFASDQAGVGYKIYTVNGWDYVALCQTYKEAIDFCRENHKPVIIHVRALTQPQGHSTSGSHERYKNKERLEWEREYDCLNQMRKWMLENNLVAEAQLEQWEKDWSKEVNDLKKEAFASFLSAIKTELNEAAELLNDMLAEDTNGRIAAALSGLKSQSEPLRRDIANAVNSALRATLGSNSESRQHLQRWRDAWYAINFDRYSSHLHSESSEAALFVNEIAPAYSENSPLVDGREVVQACFDAALARDPRVFAFGEDVGKIGDVNQGFAGLQEKYGELRVSDKGIRELTIIGEGIGAAMRGLRPIAEIQYLDYLLYALQIMSDDIATLQYRTKGGQKAPVIIRTRGHRLEGIWHSGSPMGMIIHAVRGMHVLVPRDMTRAAGMYNTLLQCDEPALVVECLNGYRIKEQLPDNIGTFTIALGKPEVLKEGRDVTLVTYGSCVRVAQDAIEMLGEKEISVELIDVQTLLPFDIDHRIVESLKKTNRIVFLDEDVPGGATSFMMQQVLEKQNGYQYLDSKPITITAKAHRPAYGTDGDYFSKPNADEIFDAIYALMEEFDPVKYL